MSLGMTAAPFRAANQYVVQERIGSGGMGTVYRVFDVQLRRHVSLKVPNRLDGRSLERFAREREIAAELDHPSFVRILTTGYLPTAEGRRPFYTMPLLEGETLDSLVAARQRRNPAGGRLRRDYPRLRLLRIVQRLCLAVASAHDRGILHRDLKPSNVMLGKYGEVYIVDLGLAKYLDEPDEPPEDRGGGESGADGDSMNRAVVGTPFYMSPEQLHDPARVDRRTDVFGLGGILYYTLTGQHVVYRSPEIMWLGFRPPGARGMEHAPRNRDAPTIHGGLDGRNGASTAEGADCARTYLRVCHNEVVPPDEFNDRRIRAMAEAGMREPVLERVDPDLSAICMKALARRPRLRHPSARALWHDLDRYIRSRPGRVRGRKGAAEGPAA